MKRKNNKLSNQTPEIRQRRVFSEDLRRKIVSDIGAKLFTVLEGARLYDVSQQTIYRWIYRYRPGLAPGTTQVVQMDSEAAKNKALLQRIADLERALGQKQMELDFLDKLVEIASQELGVDIKKNSSRTALNGSGPIKNNLTTP